jgi:hypothetical protein
VRHPEVPVSKPNGSPDLTVEIRGLGLGAGHMRHTCDGAVWQAWARGKPRGLEVFRSDIGCEKKSRGYQGFLEGRGIITLTEKYELLPLKHFGGRPG